MILKHTTKPTLSILFSAITFSIALLLTRIVITKTPFYIFLIWNLILAIIPYAISNFIVHKPKINKYILFSTLIIWLLFLPNAPYILTDLYHLRLGKPKTIWLDLLVISSFASNGLLLFYLTINDIKTISSRYLKQSQLKYIVPFLCFITGFGVYLGRFLRFNSWELFSNSNTLIKQIINILINPITHYKAWGFSLCFGVLLLLGFYSIQLVSRIVR